MQLASDAPPSQADPGWSLKSIRSDNDGCLHAPLIAKRSSCDRRPKLTVMYPDVKMCFTTAARRGKKKKKERNRFVLIRNKFDADQTGSLCSVIVHK